MAALITDSLVFICFSCLDLVSVLVFPADLFCCAGSRAKAESPPETRHDCAVFLINSGPAVKIPLISVWLMRRRAASMTTPPSTRQEVTPLLGDWSGGDQAALEKLFPLVQPELHRLAHHYMSRERAGHTLQTTAILNEAYLRLVDNTKQNDSLTKLFYGKEPRST